MYVASDQSPDSSRTPGSRFLGPLGTVARAVAGIGLILVPIVGNGLSVADALGALLVLPALAVALDRVLGATVSSISAATGRFRSATARTWAVHGSALVAILVIATALTFVTPIDAGAIWLFFGVSLLVLAARGDAGCEALAIPNAIFNRREATGCVAFSALDSFEARSVDPASTPPARAR